MFFCQSAVFSRTKNAKVIIYWYMQCDTNFTDKRISGYKSNQCLDPGLMQRIVRLSVVTVVIACRTARKT